jgi:hypothetical protein
MLCQFKNWHTNPHKSENLCYDYSVINQTHGNSQFHYYQT